MPERSLAPKSDFLNLEHGVHLAAGGQTPNLRSHLDALQRFATVKGTGLAGQALYDATRASAASRLAALLGCDPEDLGFPSSVAHAVALLVDSIDWRAGDNVVLEAWEFPSLLNPFLAQRERGVEVRLVAPRDWQASLEEVRGLMDERTRVLALSHVSYLTGERHDLDSYAALARDVGALFVVDASHALGAVAVHAPSADFVFSCCYKWVLGIQGTAVAYWNRERAPDWRPRLTGWHSVDPRAPLERHLGPDPYRTGRVFEPGNPTYAGLYVLDNALRYLEQLGTEAIEAHVLAMSAEVRAGLEAMGLPIITPREARRRAGNQCFAAPQAKEIRRRMEERGVLLTGEDGRVRISTHLYNDSADVERAIEVLGEVLGPG